MLSDDIHAQQRATHRDTASSVPFQHRRRTPAIPAQTVSLTVRQLAQRERRAREAAAKAALQTGQDGSALGVGGAVTQGVGIGHLTARQVSAQGAAHLPQDDHVMQDEMQEPRPLQTVNYRSLGQQNRRQRDRAPQVQHALLREQAAGITVGEEGGSDSDSDTGGDDDPFDPFMVDGGPMWEKQLESRIQKTKKSPLYLAARQPYTEPDARHDLGRMDVVCPHCGALHWKDERLSNSKASFPEFGTCCQRGQVQLEPMPPPPEPLRKYLTSNDPASKHFRENMWQYNRAFSFTSMGVREDHSVNGPGRGPPVFRVSGELHHYSGALEAPDGSLPRYAQLYVIEPRDALAARRAQNVDLNRGVMRNLQKMLLESPQLLPPCISKPGDILQGYDANEDISVTLRLDAGMDKRRYNLPTVSEVAVIIPGPGDTHPRDIVLRRSDKRGLDRISELHPAYVPLQYPLLAPYGTHQWHPDIYLIETDEQKANRLSKAAKRRQERNERDGVEDDEGGEDVSAQHDRKVTLSTYTAFRIHQREAPDFNLFLRGGRLFQRYIVDMYAAVDQGRLRYITMNQSKFRAARFNNLEDAVL
ncbi:hypothetical protein NMY22_g14933 [Coprinellus aureogranulatus]|nr:hypothetical protein NMY22_g14933 [Coprinellus aureogranulatus]